jgi:hypothetical protein
MIIKFFEILDCILCQMRSTDLEGQLKTQIIRYRVNYPNDYKTENNLSITKFERDYSKASPEAWKIRIKKTFNINLYNISLLVQYPISISSMPVSYDTSQLLKCNVSFFYQ